MKIRGREAIFNVRLTLTLTGSESLGQFRKVSNDKMIIMNNWVLAGRRG